MLTGTFKYDENGDLITQGMGRYLLPNHHVGIIYKNMLAGKPWNHASPMYYITREQAAFIITHIPYPYNY